MPTMQKIAPMTPLANARVAFVLVDAEPLGIGQPRLHE